MGQRLAVAVQLEAEPGGHRGLIRFRAAPANAAVIGAGAVHVWVRSSTPDVDLLATVTEVRPDGNETFVQNGWIRASQRKLATGANNIFKQPSTLLTPIPTERPRTSQPMPKGKFVEVVIPLYYEGHVYRAGSRIRVTISAPNGTQPIWAFAQTEPEGDGQSLGRVLQGDAVEPDPPGRARGERADRPAGVPEPAQRAVPALRGTHRSRLEVLAVDHPATWV